MVHREYSIICLFYPDANWLKNQKINLYGHRGQKLISTEPKTLMYSFTIILPIMQNKDFSK